MAGEGITFNDKKVREFFDKIAKNTKEIADHDKSFWSIISGISFKDVINHFEKEVGPSGKWQAWSDVYAARMISIGKQGNKILQDTGNLRQSLRLADTSTRIKKGQLLYNPAQSKDGKPYAYNHDTGSGGMPQRNFMWLSLRAMNNISKATAQYYLKGV